MMSSPAQVVNTLSSAAETAIDQPVPDSPQAQIQSRQQQLAQQQKLVEALVQSLQEQQDSFDLESLTGEAVDGHHEEEEPKPPLRRGFQFKPNSDIIDEGRPLRSARLDLSTSTSRMRRQTSLLRNGRLMI